MEHFKLCLKIKHELNLLSGEEFDGIQDGLVQFFGGIRNLIDLLLSSSALNYIQLHELASLITNYKQKEQLAICYQNQFNLLSVSQNSLSKILAFLNEKESWRLRCVSSIFACSKTIFSTVPNFNRYAPYNPMLNKYIDEIFKIQRDTLPICVQQLQSFDNNNLKYIEKFIDYLIRKLRTPTVHGQFDFSSGLLPILKKYFMNDTASEIIQNKSFKLFSMLLQLKQLHEEFDSKLFKWFTQTLSAEKYNLVLISYIIECIANVLSVSPHYRCHIIRNNIHNIIVHNILKWNECNPYDLRLVGLSLEIITLCYDNKLNDFDNTNGEIKKLLTTITYQLLKRLSQYVNKGWKRNIFNGLTILINKTDNAGNNSWVTSHIQRIITNKQHFDREAVVIDDVNSSHSNDNIESKDVEQPIDSNETLCMLNDLIDKYDDACTEEEKYESIWIEAYDLYTYISPSTLNNPTPWRLQRINLNSDKLLIAPNKDIRMYFDGLLDLLLVIKKYYNDGMDIHLNELDIYDDIIRCLASATPTDLTRNPQSFHSSFICKLYEIDFKHNWLQFQQSISCEPWERLLLIAINRDEKLDGDNYSHISAILQDMNDTSVTKLSKICSTDELLYCKKSTLHYDKLLKIHIKLLHFVHVQRIRYGIERAFSETSMYALQIALCRFDCITIGIDKRAINSLMFNDNYKLITSLVEDLMVNNCSVAAVIGIKAIVNILLYIYRYDKTNKYAQVKDICNKVLIDKVLHSDEFWLWEDTIFKDALCHLLLIPNKTIINYILLTLPSIKEITILMDIFVSETFQRNYANAPFSNAPFQQTKLIERDLWTNILQFADNGIKRSEDYRMLCQNMFNFAVKYIDIKHVRPHQSNLLILQGNGPNSHLDEFTDDDISLLNAIKCVEQFDIEYADNSIDRSTIRSTLLWVLNCRDEYHPKIIEKVITILEEKYETTASVNVKYKERHNIHFMLLSQTRMQMPEFSVSMSSLQN